MRIRFFNVFLFLNLMTRSFQPVHVLEKCLENRLKLGEYCSSLDRTISPENERGTVDKAYSKFVKKSDCSI